MPVTMYAATPIDEAPLYEVDRRSPAYIRWVQESLNRIIGSGLVTDGVMGPHTRNAARAFQGQRGLVADGVVGPRTEAALVAAGASPPPGAGSSPTPSGPSAAAAVIGRDIDPPTCTLYLDITLGGEAPARAMTGVFVPSNYRRDRSIDLVVYLHGFKLEIPRMSINRYWDKHRLTQRGLREGVNASTRNVLLAAPTLGPRSQAGWLVQAGALDTYVDLLLDAIRHNIFADTGFAPDVGNLILVGHSGGGQPLRQVALMSRRYADRIRECWGFDCLYNAPDPAEWTSWAKAHPDAKLYVHYTDNSGTKANSLKLKARGLPNVSVERSPAVHDFVPITHWGYRLAAAPFLTDR